MNRKDQRRYLVVGSVILEVVTPLFQQRIEHDFTTGGFGSLQAFINSQQVIHTLFHLRHRNSWCCKDKAKCRNHTSLPLVYFQWNKLYSENPGPGVHNCHCKFTANPIQLNELDISLSSLILLNCCTLSQSEEEAVQLLRQYKNDYLSHNTTGCITQNEYNTLWPDIVTYILRLDPTKKDDLMRIENRPLDESLCKKYFTFLLDLHQQIEEIKSTMLGVHSSIQAVSSSIIELNSSVQTKVQGVDTAVQRMNTTVQGMDTTVQGMYTTVHRMDTSVQGMDVTVQRFDTTVLGLDTTVQGMNATVQGMNATVQEMGNSFQGIKAPVKQTNDLLKALLQNGLTCECGKQLIAPLYNDQRQKHRKQYQLGKKIFYLHQKVTFQSLFKFNKRELITDVKMMDDGRLVFCLPIMDLILICNTDGSQTESIYVQGKPRCITPVIDSTVAVAVESQFVEELEPIKMKIEIYDINNKHKLKSIPLEMLSFSGLTMINNKLVVGTGFRLLLIDYQTGETVQVIETDGITYGIHASGDKIFFKDHFSKGSKKKKIKMYSYSDNQVYTKTLPSEPASITSLQDGSLYVLCGDGSIHHVSNDLKHTKKVKINNIKGLKGSFIVSYNTTQNKMVVSNRNILSIFHEKKYKRRQFTLCLSF